MEREIISKEDTQIILRTPPSQYTLTLLRDWLAATQEGEARFPFTGLLEIPADFYSPPSTQDTDNWDVRYAPNWKSIKTTTVGRFIANNLVFSHTKEMRMAMPYVDKPWDDKTINSIQQDIMDNLLAGIVNSKDMIFFIDRMQWLGYAPVSFVAPSMTINTIRAPEATRRLKKEILDSDRGTRLREGDLNELGLVEKELIASARKELEDKDPGFDIFASGARGSLGNNFKATALMRGAIRKSDDPSKITISTASLEEGIPANELPAYADLIVQASYGRSMMTANGGYIAKQLNAAFQGLQLDPDANSDCRTALTLRVDVDNPREYLFRYYVQNGKLKEVMPDTLSDIKGRTIEFRSPLYCGNKNGICAKCAGSLHHRIGITNIGLIAGRIGTTLMNASLNFGHISLIAGSPLEPYYHNVI